MRKTAFPVVFIVSTELMIFFPLPAFSESSEGHTPSGIEFNDLEERIQLFMQEHIGISTPGASVVIVKDGEIIFSGAYGLADVEEDIPVDSDTVFEYGSISKLFVWVSAMQLVEQDKLDLDTDIRTYFPEAFNKKWKHPYSMTMRDLMNHSGGFGEYPFDLLLAEDTTEEKTLADTILNAHPKQYYEPGTASAYSNYGAAVAGYVIECISGKPFYLYQKENIFDRIGMKNTAGHVLWKDNPGILEHKGQGYAPDKEGGFTEAGWSRFALYPAGSADGTAGDLALFAMALMPAQRKGSPLFRSQDSLSTIFSHSYEAGASGTSHGFQEFGSASSPAFGHSGNTVGFSAQLAIVPEERFGLIVLTNVLDELDITFGLQDLLRGQYAGAAAARPSGCTCCGRSMLSPRSWTSLKKE